MEKRDRHRASENLEAQLLKLIKQAPEGSKETRRKREGALRAVCRFLHETFRLQRLKNLKPKHIDRLLKEWRDRGVSVGEIQNRLSYIRWLAERLGKDRLISTSNADLGLEKRERYTHAGKTMPEDKREEIIGRLDNDKDKMMILCGRHFGMRFKEAALFRPYQDVDGNILWIKRGTKGGRPRFIRLVNDAQWAVLEGLRWVANGKEGCLVDPAKQYKSWKSTTYKRFRAAGLSREVDHVFHDLRRTWADEEFARLRAKGLSIRAAATIVAKRLGHNRLEVLKWYLPGGGMVCQ